MLSRECELILLSCISHLSVYKIENILKHKINFCRKIPKLRFYQTAADIAVSLTSHWGKISHTLQIVFFFFFKLEIFLKKLLLVITNCRLLMGVRLSRVQ